MSAGPSSSPSRPCPSGCPGSTRGPDAFPRLRAAQNVDPIVDADPARRIAAAPDGAIVLVMTHSHALDLEIARPLSPPRRFAARRCHRLGDEAGAVRLAAAPGRASTTTSSARLVCPIGLPGIHGKEPATIAASVAAQCLLVAPGAAVESGENPDPARDASSQGTADRL